MAPGYDTDKAFDTDHLHRMDSKVLKTQYPGEGEGRGKRCANHEFTAQDEKVSIIVKIKCGFTYELISSLMKVSGGNS